jgi:hypothetical protein
LLRILNAIIYTIARKKGSKTKSKMDKFGEAPIVSKINESRQGAKIVNANLMVKSATLKKLIL